MEKNEENETGIKSKKRNWNLKQKMKLELLCEQYHAVNSNTKN